MTNLSNNAAINKMLKSIQGKHGSVYEESYGLGGVISTGSMALDDALDIGGVPNAGVVEMLGEPSAGKTSLALSVLSQAQKARAGTEKEDWEDIIIDLEHSMSTAFIAGFDIDTDKVIHVRPNSAEEALQIARDLPKLGTIGVVVFDSVGAAQTAKMQAKDVGAADVGSIAKLMHDTMRPISKLATETETLYIFLNHITYKIGVMYGNPKTSPGGQALRFYSNMRLELLGSKPAANAPGAFLMRVKIVKNKCGVPWTGEPVEILFYYGKGPDPIAETIERARSEGYLRHSSGRSKMRLSLDEEWYNVSDTIDKGKAAAIDYLRENPDLVEQLKLAME